MSEDALHFMHDATPGDKSMLAKILQMRLKTSLIRMTLVRGGTVVIIINCVFSQHLFCEVFWFLCNFFASLYSSRALQLCGDKARAHRDGDAKRTVIITTGLSAEKNMLNSGDFIRRFIPKM